MDYYIKAIVQKVIMDGKHGPYVIASSNDVEGSITFSLEPTVWREKDSPETGNVVYLSNILKKRAGWRAKEGRFWKPSDEQRAERTIVMSKLEIFIKKLSGKFFPREEDKIWKQWVDFKNRDTKDLIGLLSTDVRDSFKKRALFLLISPSASFNTIYWNGDIGKFYHNNKFLNVLNLDQLNYAANLIIEFCTILKPMHCDRPKSIVEGGGGITIHIAVRDKYHNALYFYNDCILHLLTLLPTEKAKKIFPFFSILDISTYESMEDASGYNPFCSLLCDKKVDERWKIAADNRMREIIIGEISGKLKPREKWEEAIRQYAYVINLMLYGDMQYSLDLYASQVQFMMDNRHNQSGLIDNWNVIKLFNVLFDNKYRELRHIIAKYVLLEDNKEHSRFSIYSNETQAAADYILKEFSADTELVDKINLLQDKRNKSLIENSIHQNNKRKTEEELRLLMK